MMAKKAPKFKTGSKTYDKIAQQKPTENRRFRDVHESQQMGRSTIGDKKTGKRYWILSSITGFLVFIAVWLLWSLFTFIGVHASGLTTPGYTEEWATSGGTCYYQLDADQNRMSDTCFPSEDAVPEPAWHAALVAEQEAKPQKLSEHIEQVTGFKVLISVSAGLMVLALLMSKFRRMLDVQNIEHDTEDINQHDEDQHLALPEEVIAKFSPFPDAGAHSHVQASSIISHVMLENKRKLKNVDMVQRSDHDVVDENGNVITLKYEALKNSDGSLKTKQVPIIDTAFGDELFTASGLPDEKSLRRRFDPTVAPYNPGNADRDKLKGDFDTIADLINNDWIFPEYETQRPAGVYLVDTAPVNTMIIAITRAGKGQTYIEPMLDIWMRERDPSNIVVNDPKGELLVKNYVSASVRGYQVVQFNLINPQNTDIYNPLGLAVEASRENDVAKCASYIENIGEVFFPTDSGDDPVWPTSANNAFKRAVYGLIDYYLEEEAELRNQAARDGISAGQLETQLDAMWGRVSLYNVYQLFVQLTAKKKKSPVVEFAAQQKNGDFDGMDDDVIQEMMADAEARSELWEGKDETDLLSLFFAASEKLPTSSMRNEVMNSHNSLKSMAGAEKMLASVYGISISALNYFTDPTISTLTSGTPSQNADLGGMSFPRRMGVQLNSNFVKDQHLIGSRAVWQAYADEKFTESLGKDFSHEDVVSRDGWARYFFKGLFEQKISYVKLELFTPGNANLLMHTFYFKFRKGYRKSLNGRRFVKDPVTDELIVSNGTLMEMIPGDDGEMTLGSKTFSQQELEFDTDDEGFVKQTTQIPVIQSVSVRYTEKPKMVFLVTPPHLMKYAKLLLILIKQLVDLNFDKSYLTKENQKPLYRTRFMLDELGNLQSEGHGIANFQTMLSIGLGQEQQFTLILQTLQQLRDVYGESVDKIVQGNVSNIVFLKSTDDSLVETLENMAGTHHVVRRNSKSVRRDNDKITMKVSGDVSYTYQAEKESLISKNDFLAMPERNSVVLRAGDSPVWNRNETILPMSWKLLGNTIKHPGHDYSLQNVPTLSSAIDFDVSLNQPNFMDMLNKRMEQAYLVDEAVETYKDMYDYSDYDISRLDRDMYSAEIMRMVNSKRIQQKLVAEAEAQYRADISEDNIEDNDVMRDTVENQRLASEQNDRKAFAGGTISRSDLVHQTDPSQPLFTEDGRISVGVQAKHSIDSSIVEAYLASRAALESDTNHFTVGAKGELRGLNQKTYIEPSSGDGTEADAARRASSDPAARVFADSEDTVSTASDTYTVSDEFIIWLASLSTWDDLGDGAFERAMATRMS